MELKEYKNIGDIMSNFDGQIEDGSEKKLKSGKFCGDYSAWNFYGQVFYNKEERKFQCEIMQFHVHVDTFKGKTLQEIMEQVSNKYGFE